MEKGKACFQKNQFSEAAIEFENVLLLDPLNVPAKFWLVKVYLKLENRNKAKEFLELAKSQDPDVPEILELEKLLGEAPIKVTHREQDLVMHETLTLLGKNRSSIRQFGLVIPEDRVRTETEIGKLKKDSGTEEKIPEEMGLPPMLEEANKVDEGPLFEVFDTWTLEGLNAGLETYFEIVGEHRSLAMLSDKGLLKEGEDFFEPRFKANPDDQEAGYFLGMITYFNGDMNNSRKILEPLRNSKYRQTPGGKLVFAHFAQLLEEEEARKIAQLELERKKAEEAKAKDEAKAIAAAKRQSAQPQGEAAAPAGSADAADVDGYEMYKKGQLDGAIDKFREAIKKNGQEPKFYYHLGLAHTDKALGGSLPDFDRAIEAFNNVIRVSPGTKLAREAEIMIRDIVAAKNSL